MAWENLKRGVWTRYGPIDRLDPYLLWADTTGFADFQPDQWRARGGGRCAPPATIPVLIELRLPPAKSELLAAAMDPLLLLLPQLRIAVSGYLFLPGSRFHTFDIKPAFYRLLAAFPQVKKFVRRIELSMPVTPERIGGKIVVIGSTNNPPRAGTALGIIDDGCPFAHVRLRKKAAPDETRLLAIWDQDGRLGKDGLLRADEMNAHIQAAGPADGGPIDEALCYESAGYGRLRKRATHGAHLLDVLAGPVPPRNRVPGCPTRPPTFEPETGTAAEAGIVFVQLPKAAVQDNSGKWLGKQVLEGLRVICEETSASERLVVNISYGPQTGPHDGSSMLEQAIDEMHDLMKQKTRSLAVTLPTGNSFNNRSHASFSLRRGACQRLVWQVPPGSEAAAFMEIWLPARSRRTALEIELVPPGGKAQGSGRIGRGKMKVWPDRDKPSAAVIFLGNVPQSDARTMALIALAPTFSFDPDRALAPAGRWIVKVHNVSKRKLRHIEAYIARNGTDLGASLRGRESHFVDSCFDRYKYLRPADDDGSQRVSAIRRRGSISGLATGLQTRVLAGYRLSDRTVAKYSSAGPSARFKNPDWAAVSDEGYSLPGLRGAGTRSGSFVRLAGTSVCAPQEARRIADNNGAIALPDPIDEERAGRGLAPLP